MITTTKINLLPWREKRRKERQQEFIIMLVVAAAVAGLVFFAWQQYVNSQITFQGERNRMIQSRITVLDRQIAEINQLEQRRAELIERMRVIQDLQGNRPTIVYVFDELVRTLPDGVYYTSVRRRGDVYTISGIAESNARISRLMRNFDESPWFTEPNLQSVTAVGGSGQANRFNLTVRQGSPRTAEEADQ